MQPKAKCFALVSDQNATEKGWRIVKDLYKDEGIDLDALNKDDFAAMHFG